MTWWQRLWNKREMEERLDRELRFHFDCQVADNIRAGMSEAEARRQARLKFGGFEGVKEECRTARGTAWVDSTLEDIRFSLSTLRKSPAFTVAAHFRMGRAQAALQRGASGIGFRIVRLGGCTKRLADRLGAAEVTSDESLVDDSDLGRSLRVVRVKVPPGEHGGPQGLEVARADPGELRRTFNPAHTDPQRPSLRSCAGAHGGLAAVRA